MSKQRPRPGPVSDAKPAPDFERADHIIARAAQGGPEHYLRDIEGWRQEFQAEREDGKPSAYWAFMAVATSTARHVAELDGNRSNVGLPPVRNYDKEVPQRMVEMPLWAAVALSNGWLNATVGKVREDQSTAGAPHPIPLAEAFGLAGESGSRTVGRRHLRDRRDRNVALEVEMLLAQNPALSAHAAHGVVAETAGMTVKTVERAHTRWGEQAKARLIHFDIIGQPMSKP
jgi:hypothetical protein